MKVYAWTTTSARLEVSRQLGSELELRRAAALGTGIDRLVTARGLPPR